MNTHTPELATIDLREWLDLNTKLINLRAERDELLAALQDVTDAYERALNRFGAHEWGMLTIETARAALAKVQS